MASSTGATSDYCQILAQFSPEAGGSLARRGCGGMAAESQIPPLGFRTYCERNLHLVHCPPDEAERWLKKHEQVPDIPMSNATWLASLGGMTPVVEVAPPLDEEYARGLNGHGQLPPSNDLDGQPWWQQVWSVMTSKNLFQWLWKWYSGSPLEDIPLQNPLNLIAWHSTQPVVAVGADVDRVILYHLAENRSDRSLEWTSVAVLQAQLQRKLCCVAFRPGAGSDIAVGCSGGVALWRSALNPNSRMRFLQAPGSGPIECLSWHPSGRLLAGAGPGAAGFTVWDASVCVGTTISHGMERILVMSWSPCGNYFVTGGPTSCFHMWETHNWTCTQWDTKQQGSLVAAEWGSDSMLLLAFSATSVLWALTLVAPPPLLDTEWFELSPKELASPEESRSPIRGAMSASKCIESMAWDSKHRRLVVALKQPHPAAGCIAVYDTTATRRLNAAFLGYARVLEVRPGT
eukprot:evm.model.scf_749.1 EVM.evm.TU.scf_749.1   scf_749:25688-33425(-)